VKILTLLGTRPEIIRLSRLIERLDQVCDHVLVDTGQNFDPGLSEIFFSELGVREPDHRLAVRGASFGERIGQIVAGSEAVLRSEHPDRLLILGDTDSGLAAIVAKRLGITVLHMEAGNRCYDDRVPEEVNRRVIDHSSDALLPYTERSRANLLREGIAGERIFVTGNPIREVMLAHREAAAASRVLTELGVPAGGYLLVSAHRQETVDRPERLELLARAIAAVQADQGLPVVLSLHPRTHERLRESGVSLGEGAVGGRTFGFIDFLALETGARCVLSDSGTVQEECCLLGVPTVTLREVTERPETVECGSNILSGVEPEAVVRGVRAALGLAGVGWNPPREYLVEDVSSIVARIAVGRLPGEAW
jgi:UDP-N-acetylglucosamine 2-epimerase (non-hydrolysing)